MNDNITVGIPNPKTNFLMRIGEGTASFQFHLYVERTLLNRFKYWMFFQFFPFKLVEWGNA